MDSVLSSRLSPPFKTEALKAARLIRGQSVTGSHCISGGLAVIATEDSSSVGGRLRASDPSILSEEGEAQTQGTPCFLYEEIQSGNIIGKKNLQKLDSLYFCGCFLSHIQISELTMIFTQSNKWLVYDVKEPQTSKAT